MRAPRIALPDNRQVIRRGFPTWPSVNGGRAANDQLVPHVATTQTRGTASGARLRSRPAVWKAAESEGPGVGLEWHRTEGFPLLKTRRSLIGPVCVEFRGPSMKSG
jgi:hypothetical protein